MEIVPCGQPFQINEHKGSERENEVNSNIWLNFPD